jgi:hypothetical protein
MLSERIHENMKVGLEACISCCFLPIPSASVWNRLFAQVPALSACVQSAREITTPAFPRHPRYGSRAGQPNPLFLDSEAFIAFLSPLEPFAIALAVIIFEFPLR